MKREIKIENYSGNGEIVIYQGKGKKIIVEAKLQKDTIWLTQAQIALLFGTKRPAITKHLKNIFESGELDRNSVCSILEHTATDNKNYKIQLFNLDAVLSIGYRVNSMRATQFRIWATKILRDHIVKGYAFNKKRLAEIKEKQFQEFQEAVALIKKTTETKQLSGEESEGLLRVITEYANSWLLLQKYDEDKIAIPAKIGQAKFRIDYNFSKKAINELGNELLNKKEAGDLFGQERGVSFRGILGNIYQTFGGKELYKSLEEKAAHLLYFLIKDHPFSDGNKRIGSFLFIVFLAKNNYLFKKNGERKINDNALVALALLIAESQPKQKDVLVKLITNLITQ